MWKGSDGKIIWRRMRGQPTKRWMKDITRGLATMDIKGWKVGPKPTRGSKPSEEERRKKKEYHLKEMFGEANKLFCNF